MRGCSVAASGSPALVPGPRLHLILIRFHGRAQRYLPPFCDARWTVIRVRNPI